MQYFGASSSRMFYKASPWAGTQAGTAWNNFANKFQALFFVKSNQFDSFITLEIESSDLFTLKKIWFIRFLKRLFIYHKENSSNIVELFSISQDWPRSRKSMQAEEEDSSKNKQNFKDWKKPRHSRRSSSHRGVLTVIEGVLASLKPRPASGMAAWPSRAVVAKV